MLTAARVQLSARPKAGLDNVGSQKTQTKMITRTLTEVLATLGAPAYIDYMSLDVEGAEARVLDASFAWNRYRFGLLTIERPPPSLNSLLFTHGYLFAQRWGNSDVYYVHKSHPTAGKIAHNESFVQIPAKCIDYRRCIDRLPRMHAAGLGPGYHPTAHYGCCEWPGFPEFPMSSRHGTAQMALR